MSNDQIDDARRGAIARHLTEVFIVDMPTARAIVDAALAAPSEPSAEQIADLRRQYDEWEKRATQAPEQTPQWMVDMAARVAADHVPIGHRNRLQRAIIDCMVDAGREVALHFAANPQPEHQWLKCQACGQDMRSHDKMGQCPAKGY
jgi:hypothetical protein